MARTKSSRGMAPFTLRSGNSPLSLIGGLIGGAIALNKSKKNKNKNNNTGVNNTLGDKLDAINTKLDNLSTDGTNTGGINNSLAGNDANKVNNDTTTAITDGTVESGNEEEEILNKEVTS